MELSDYLQQQFKAAHNLLNSAIDNTPQELVNRRPGEQCNTIAAAYAHVTGSEDYFLQVALQGKPRLWESGAWAQTLGITAQVGSDWSISIPDLAAFRVYATAVHSAAEAYLATLTSADLDRVIKIFGNDRPAARALVITLMHLGGHAGEIATLKAALGVKGLPF